MTTQASKQTMPSITEAVMEGMANWQSRPLDSAGLGPHYCVGAPLARIEALTALLTACPDVRMDPDSLPSFYYGARGFVQHGTDALPVLIGP